MKLNSKILAFAGIMAVLICSSAIAEETPITQGEWAVYLARGLGLEKVMPAGSSADKYISILGNKGYRRIEGEDYYKISPELSIVESDEFGFSSKKKWLSAKENPGTAHYRFDIPVGRQYSLRARNRGMSQFWTIDDRGSVMLSPDLDFKWMEVGEYNLQPGPHEITVSVPAGGGVDLFELLTESAPAIEPPGGFQPLAPLTYGDKAITIVKALNLEDELPIDAGFSLVLEAELYERAKGQLQISEDDKQGAASGKKWLQADGEISAFYSFEVPERGLYTIKARGFGDQKEEWTFDLGEERLIFTPTSISKFNWQPVSKVFFEPGPHTIEVVLREGNGTDVIMIARCRATAANYLQLLSDLGLQEGALPAKKVVTGGRRYQLYEAIEAEKYRQITGEVEKDESDRHGEPSGQAWIRPKNGSAVCRYEVELKEDGMYALYMRSFGPSFLTWTIDPEGDSCREKRDSFPADGEEFDWAEVVTLDLARGKHIFEVSIPASDGLDIFELRKRVWSQADLERLASRAVSREEALSNLEEVESRAGKGEGEEEEEEEPEPTPGPGPTPGYVPLSPYIPGA
jgi:hypothetical protein